MSSYHVNVFASPLHRVVGFFCFDGPPKKTIVYSLQVVLCCHGSTINAFGGHVPQVVAITDRQSELICMEGDSDLYCEQIIVCTLMVI